MPTVTPADRETADAVIVRGYIGQIRRDEQWSIPDTLRSSVAAALAEQRERLTAAHVADLASIQQTVSDWPVVDCDERSGRLESAERFCRERLAELKGE